MLAQSTADVTTLIFIVFSPTSTPSTITVILAENVPLAVPVTVALPLLSIFIKLVLLDLYCIRSVVIVFETPFLSVKLGVIINDLLVPGDTITLPLDMLLQVESLKTNSLASPSSRTSAFNSSILA